MLSLHSKDLIIRMVFVGLGFFFLYKSTKAFIKKEKDKIQKNIDKTNIPNIPQTITNITSTNQSGGITTKNVNNVNKCET